jgi:hypothetical protein
VPSGSAEMTAWDWIKGLASIAVVLYPAWAALYVVGDVWLGHQTFFRQGLVNYHPPYVARPVDPLHPRGTLGSQQPGGTCWYCNKAPLSPHHLGHPVAGAGPSRPADTWADQESNLAGRQFRAWRLSADFLCDRGAAGSPGQFGVAVHHGEAAATSWVAWLAIGISLLGLSGKSSSSCETGRALACSCGSRSRCRSVASTLGRTTSGSWWLPTTGVTPMGVDDVGLVGKNPAYAMTLKNVRADGLAASTAQSSLS